MDSARTSENGWQSITQLSPGERAIVNRAKKEHAETTQAAKRALLVAEETQTVARQTLVEVHRQGQALDKVEAGFVAIEEDVHEASSLLRFMRRWCCIQVLCCCDCFDPDVQRDRTRQRRLKQRQARLQAAHSGIEMEYAAKQQAIDRNLRRSDTAANGSSEAAARSELLIKAAQVKEARRGARPGDIGVLLPEEDRQEVQQQSEEQEAYLDRIGEAVGNLHVMSQEMADELVAQDPKIDRLQQRAEDSHFKLGGLAREARRI